MKILAVDDDTIVLGILSDVLKSAEFGEVHTCDSAEKALELIGTATKPFTCFLLDINMPGMDGIELCRTIRGLAQHADTPILMLTSMKDKTNIDRAFSSGASDYLTKPLDATEIVVRMGIAEKLMKERKSLAESAGVIDSLIDVLDRTTQHELEEAIDLGKMDRLLRYPAFENYIFQIGRGNLFLSTVFAAKVRNVQNLHRILPPLEFKNFLRGAASAIMDRLDSNDAYITYRGKGEFVGFVPRKGQHVLKALGEEISVVIEESDGKHAEKLPATATLVLAPAAPIRLPTRGELSKAISTAVNKARLKTEPLAHQDAKLRLARRMPPGIARLRQHKDDVTEDLRAEFTQLLREQLNSEIGEHRKPTPISKKKPRPKIFKRDVPPKTKNRRKKALCGVSVSGAAKGRKPLESARG